MEIKYCKLKEFENHLANISKIKDTNNDTEINSLFRLICQIAGIQIENDVESSIFQQNNSQQQRLFVSAALIRIIGYNERLIWDLPIQKRIKVFKIIDESFSDEYRNFGFNSKTGNHIKLQKFRDLENLILTEAKIIQNSIHDLSNVNASWKNLKSFLKKSPNKILIHSMIDPILLNDKKIDELFQYIQQYHESLPILRVSIYDKLKPIYEEYLKCCLSNGSLFVEECISKIFQKYFNLIEQEHKLNVAIKNTKLRFALTYRKYPLHSKSSEFNLHLDIFNNGPGVAYEAEIIVLENSPEIEIQSKLLHIGSISIGKVEVQLPIKLIKESDKNPWIYLKLIWYNFNKSQDSVELLEELLPQKKGIDWAQLATKQPYSLEAVKKETEFFGRSELINILIAKLYQSEIESLLIWGQKRVGKTSICKRLQSLLSQKIGYICVYLASGDLDKTNSQCFISSLGNEIVNQICINNVLTRLKRPVFHHSLSPLLNFLRNITQNEFNFYIVIIIDEFDEIPLSIYPYTEIGDGFFQNLRSISSLDKVSFVLVGGENMQFIKQHTDKLNKFETFPVDYFEKSKYWSDFQDLIQKPVAEIIEFTDQAVEKIYEYTEGNPFYTKFICRKIYTYSVKNRDVFITGDEVENILANSITDLDTNQVSHFWLDGFVEQDKNRKDIIETQRRLFLVIYSSAKKSNPLLTKQALEKNMQENFNLSVDDMIKSYRSRQILYSDDNALKLKPKYFEKWLIEKGSDLLSTSFINDKAIEHLRKVDNELYVKDEELFTLCSSWGTYKGQRIQASQLRLWLNQFSNNKERRLIFKLLQHIQFYSEDIIREKMRVIQGSIRGLRQILEEANLLRRRDILVSSFGNIGKSGSMYARLYQQENHIYHELVVSMDKIEKIIQKNPRITTLILIDDFIGSGNTMKKALNTLANQCGEILKKRDILVVISAICGFSDTLESVTLVGHDYGFRTYAVVADQLSEADKAFGVGNDIFQNEVQKDEAKRIVIEWGNKLQNKNPLGYNAGQALIVFFDSCPNNTLPIFYCENQRFKWIPLFPRV